MNPALIGITAFLFAFGGVLLGTWARKALPKEHLEGESKDVIKLGIGLVATMTALVLGLVTASAKNAFDAIDDAIKESAVKVLVLDRTLARYGPEAGEIRLQLKRVVGQRIDFIWPKDSSMQASLDPMSHGQATRAEVLVDAMHSLKPRDDLQRALQTRAVELAEHVLQARWAAMAGTESSVPVLFLVVVVSWLTVIFATFGVFASNRTVLAVLFVCTLSIGAALFLILELDTPFDGLIQASADPIRYAYAHMNR